MITTLAVSMTSFALSSLGDMKCGPVLSSVIKYDSTVGVMFYKVIK